LEATSKALKVVHEKLAPSTKNKNKKK